MDYHAIALGNAVQVRCDIARGADVNAFTSACAGLTHFSPLHCAVGLAAGYGDCGEAKPEMLTVARLLLEAGADVDKLSSDPDGPSSALHQAAFLAREAMCKLLLAFGANPWLRTNSLSLRGKGKTALDLAWSARGTMPKEDAHKWDGVIKLLEAAVTPEGLEDSTPLN